MEEKPKLQLKLGSSNKPSSKNLNQAEWSEPHRDAVSTNKDKTPHQDKVLDNSNAKLDKENKGGNGNNNANDSGGNSPSNAEAYGKASGNSVDANKTANSNANNNSNIAGNNNNSDNIDGLGNAGNVNNANSHKKSTLYVEDLKAKQHSELIEVATEAGIDNAGSQLRQELIFQVLKKLAYHGKGKIISRGVLELLNDGYGFLRSPDANYRTGPDDVYVSPSQIKKFCLRTGDTVEGEIRMPKQGERYFALTKVTSINWEDVKKSKSKVNFDNLIPIHPNSNIKLEVESSGKRGTSGRIIDLISPIGKGQRALIVAPPKTGKTFLMKNIAQSIEANHPEIKLIVLNIDERPEEFTDMRRSVKGEVVSSTFDEPASRHVQLADMVIEKAKRLVEYGKDVVILLDSITRLARAYNTVVPSSGKVLTGGVDAHALQRPKRFFGAARNIENGGSLTIIATSLVDTGSRMDEVIFEEFKGTGNSEVVLDRKLSDKRLFPAIDILKSGTRHEELLYEKGKMQKIWLLRRIINNMGTIEATEFLISKVQETETNTEFFASMNK